MGWLDEKNVLRDEGTRRDSSSPRLRMFCTGGS